MVAERPESKTPSQQNMAQLVRAAQRGDKDSMETLAQTAERSVRRFITSQSWQTAAVDDLVQETLLAMVCALGQLQRVEAFWPWVYRIARRQVIQHWRRNRRTTTVTFSSLEEQDCSYEPLAPQEQNALAQMLFAERRAQLAAAMSRLEHKQQELIRLRCLQGLAYSQVGTCIGCTISQARTRLHRARQTLAANYARAAG